MGKTVLVFAMQFCNSSQSFAEVAIKLCGKGQAATLGKGQFKSKPCAFFLLTRRAVTHKVTCDYVRCRISYEMKCMCVFSRETSGSPFIHCSCAWGIFWMLCTLVIHSFNLSARLGDFFIILL